MIECVAGDSAAVRLTPEQESQAVKAAQRDPAEFACLYRAYVGSIYRYLYSRLGYSGCARDAEALTSQVFMEALESLPRYQQRGYFLAWLFSIPRHRLSNFRKRCPPETDMEIDELEANPGHYP
jgi:DNA-directed RNA polymerase specialized sigma24 family protein